MARLTKSCKNRPSDFSDISPFRRGAVPRARRQGCNLPRHPPYAGQAVRVALTRDWNYPKFPVDSPENIPKRPIHHSQVRKNAIFASRRLSVKSPRQRAAFAAAGRAARSHPRRTDAANECKASKLALLSGKEGNERSEVNGCKHPSLAPGRKTFLHTEFSPVNVAKIEREHFNHRASAHVNYGMGLELWVV